MKQFIILIFSIFLISACSEKKGPALKGERLNVLHYDLLKDISKVKVKIALPEQINTNAWSTSGTEQFSSIPLNIKLSQDPHFVEKTKLKNYSPSYQDSSIAIVDDVAFTYTKALLSAYDLKNKKNLWSIKILAGKEANEILGGSISYNNNVVYVSSGNRDFVAIDAKQGKELWRFKAHNVVRYIASIHDSKIYVTSIDNTLLCLNLNGNLLWRYDAPIYSLTNSHFYVPISNYENKAIGITTAGDLVVLDNNSGEELTQVNLATTSIIGDGSLYKGPTVSPFINKNNLFILDGEDDFIKIDLSAPEISWRQNFPNAKSFWVTDQVSYLITNDHQLIAIENDQGKIAWISKLPLSEKKKEQDQFFGPLLAGGQIIVANKKGDFYKFSPIDGKMIKSYKQDFVITQMPIVVNEKLYFVGKNGHLAIWQ